MPHKPLLSRTATFLHPVYSPKGGIEGMLVDLDGRNVQFAFRHEPHLEEIVALATAGDLLDVEIEPLDEHDGAAHAVYRLAGIVAPAPAEDAGEPARRTASGVVERLNFALHGEPNGVVLDTGDFVHLKPHGMRQLALAPGMAVTASGPARRLRFGPGHAIEADEVNGQALARPARPRPPKAH